LFGGDASLQVREVPYRSGGTLIERLESWLEVLRAVEIETAGLQPQQLVLLDPDSRYLQLGMLPALRNESHYYFFESRRAGPECEKTLSRLTSDWLNEALGGSETVLPRVALRRQDQEFGRQIRRRLEAGGARWLVAISFGVGGNEEKRLLQPFEEQLLARLIEEGCTVVLDHGAEEEESARAKRLAESVRGRGRTVTEIEANDGSLGVADDSPLSCAMLTWQGGIGAWAGLIGASDEYIGYDSAGQHIAAALGVPTISVFSANATERFRQRWRPTGRAEVRVIAEPARSSGAESFAAALERVIEAHQEYR
jgi:ADP-heptose:LPS heptosyltransferase